MVSHASSPVVTRSRSQWIDITGAVSRAAAASGISEGMCVIASRHTTAGITLNENADPDVERDFFSKLSRLIPQNDGYRHGEGNSDSHLKASLVGFSATVPVSGGSLVLGTWQAVYFCEFDGPRERTVSVTVVGE